MPRYGAFRFIDPKALAALGDLRLVARAVVDGVLDGIHASRLPGAGLEFSQYRSYQPGDDLRRVDWRLYARSDRFFVREAETERSFTVRLVLDASRSMQHAEGGLAKFDYARFLVASLAVLAHRQGDRLALDVLSDERTVRLPPQHGEPHVLRLLHALEQLEATGRWPVAEGDMPEPLADAGRGITVVVTDFHERTEEIQQVLRRLARRRHELIVFELLGRDEAEFRYRGSLAFEDLESGQVVDVDADAARAAYLARLAAHRATLASALATDGVRLVRVLLDEPLDGALRSFLEAREAAGAVA